MPTKLSIYNGTLLLCGSARLANITEDRPARYLLDELWDSDTINGCLESAFWNHAMRTVQIEYSQSVTPPFGPRRAFDKPTDLRKLYSLCSDEYFSAPLHQYQDEGNYWFAELDTIYVRYVSSDTSYGMDLSLWPVSFTRFVEASFAARAIKRLTDGKEDEDTVYAKLKKFRTDALSNDAMKDPVAFPPPTGWQKARQGRRAGRWYERG